MPEAPVISSPSETMKQFHASEAAPSEVIDITPPAADKPPVENKTDAPPKSISSAVDSLTDAPPANKKPPVEPPSPDLTRNPGEKDSAYIKRINAERIQYLKERDQFKTELEKRKGFDPEQLTALQKEIADRDKLIEMTAFERSAKYRNEFAKPIEQAEKKAREFITSFTDEKGVYEKALTLAGKERMDFLKEHVGEMAATAYDKISSVQDRIAAKDEAVAAQAESGGKWQKEQEQQAIRETLAEFESQREIMASKLSLLRGPNAEHYEQQARSLLTGDAPPQDIIAAARLAVIAPAYIHKCMELQGQVETLTARLAEKDVSVPRLQGRGADKGSETTGNGGKVVNGQIPSAKEMAAVFFPGR